MEDSPWNSNFEVTDLWSEGIIDLPAAFTSVLRNFRSGAGGAAEGSAGSPAGQPRWGARQGQAPERAAPGFLLIDERALKRGDRRRCSARFGYVEKSSRTFSARGMFGKFPGAARSGACPL